MKTAVEWLYEEFTKTNHLTEDEFYMKFEQAKAKEISQKAEEYLKGFKDGKEYMKKIKTFKTK